MPNAAVIRGTCSHPTRCAPLKIPLDGEGWGETPVVKGMKSSLVKVAVEQPAEVLHGAADNRRSWHQLLSASSRRRGGAQGREWKLHVTENFPSTVRSVLSKGNEKPFQMVNGRFFSWLETCAVSSRRTMP